MFIRKTIALLLALVSAVAMAAVDVNTATEADLDSIKGIGPGTSTKIMEQRKNAKFKDWEDLIQRVSGIGEKRAAKLSAEGLTVNGSTFQAGTAAKAPKTTSAGKSNAPAQPVSAAVTPAGTKQ
jgi:competence protein ComEA